MRDLLHLLCAIVEFMFRVGSIKEVNDQVKVAITIENCLILSDSKRGTTLLEG